MRNKNQKTQSIKWATAFVLAFLLFAGCRKQDTILPGVTQNYEELKSQFFDTNSTSDVEIKKLAADIKKQDSIFKFLPDFVRKNGLPKWDKVIYKTKNSSKLNGRTNSSFSPNSLNTSANRSVATNNIYDNQGVFFIPLQSTNSQVVKSYITAYKHNDSLYTYRIYNKDSLNAIQPSSNEEKNKLLNTQAVFGYFEKSINNIDSINITSPVNATLKNVNIDFDNSASSATSNGNINSFNFGDDCTWSVSVRITYIALLVTDGHLAAIVLVPVSTTISITIDCTGSGGGGGCGCGGTPGSPGGGSPSGTPGGGTPGNTTGGTPSGGSPSGSNNTGNTPHWWNYGTGWPWYGGSGGNNPQDWNWWWTSGGGGFGGGGGTSFAFSPTVTSVAAQLNVSYSQAIWLEANQTRAAEINNFLNNTVYSDLNFNDKAELATRHLNVLIDVPEYLEMVDSYSSSMSLGHPWMIDLFKELGIEIGLKVIKKYLPGYGDWQSIKDALDNAGHGDWLGALGEVLNIVKKKVPWIATVDAAIDTFIFSSLANKAWQAFDKIKALPTNAFNGLLKTIKDKCGGIIEKVQHDPTMGANSKQAIILYNPADAENFFRDIANNIGVTVNSTNSPGRFYFDVGGFRFNFYPDSTSNGDPTIEIIFPNTTRYKFRIRG